MMMRPNPAFVLTLTAISCVNEDRVDEMIAERLIAEKLIEPPPPEVEEGGVPAAEPQVDAAAESQAFLTKLDELMADYAPDLPEVQDAGDLLRCVTEDALKNDPALKGARRSLEKKRTASVRAREKATQKFRDEVVPLNYRIDYDWETRKSGGRPPVYGCHITYRNGKEKWLESQSECYWHVRQRGHAGQKVDPRRIRVPGVEAKPTYGDGPPELMARIKAASIAVPAHFSCRVLEVSPKKQGRFVSCSEDSGIVVKGDSARVNIGDLISVPLKDTKADPDGVLVKGGESWVVHAAGSALTVDEHASCPSVEEILAAVQGG